MPSPTSDKNSSCADTFLSIRFLLPVTVAVMVTAMAATTLGLMATNTTTAVESVVTTLQDQVSSTVQNEIENRLVVALTLTNGTAKQMLQINAFPVNYPNSSRCLPTFTNLMAVLDRQIVTWRRYIDTHYFFHANGRLQAVATVGGLPGYFYVEEQYPLGISFMPYQETNLTDMNLVFTRPEGFFVPGYKGSEREYFWSPSHKIGFDFAWTAPYSVGPLLLFTLTMSMVDAQGVFRGVIGTDIAVESLQSFLVGLQPTPRTVTFVAAADSLLTMASSGAVLDVNGSRIPVAKSQSEVIAAAGKRIGDFSVLGASTRHTIKVGDEEWLLSVALFNKFRFKAFVAVVTPRSEFMGAADRQTNITIGICCAIAAAGIIIIVALCVKISFHLFQLENNLVAVSRLEFDDDGAQSAQMGEVPTKAGGEGGGAAQDLNGGGFTELEHINQSYRKLRTAVRAFKHYVPEHVVRGLLGGTIDAQLGMLHNNAAIAFQDIVNFTSMCEALPTLQVMRVVSKSFEQMSHAIHETDGVIDKYIGDCIMSFWEVGFVTPAGRVLDGADVCARALTALQKSYDFRTSVEGMSVSFRTGVHYGTTLMGNFGSSTRFSYTVVGDTVNTAARLEPLNKQLKTEVLVSEDVMGQLPLDHPVRSFTRDMGAVLVVGKTKPITVYELRATRFSNDEADGWHAVIDQFAKGHNNEALRGLRGLTLRFPSTFGDAATEAFANALSDDASSSSPVGVRVQAGK